tara:strand:- start:122 stop:835 length:714 start_codon:yes stop_codon:yes gene_type:complete
MKVLINADDYLLTDKISEGILYALKRKFITTTSVVANGIADNSIYVDKYLSDFKNKEVGMHFVLTCGEKMKPLIPFKNTLINENGLFIPKKEFLDRVIQIDYEWVEDELRAQLQKVLEMGFNITYANFHHHIHSWDDKILKIYAAILRDNNIRGRAIDQRTRTLLRTLGVRVSDEFIEQDWANEINTKGESAVDDLHVRIKTSKSKSIEINCHASFADANSLTEITFFEKLKSLRGF